MLLDCRSRSFTETAKAKDKPPLCHAFRRFENRNRQLKYPRRSTPRARSEAPRREIQGAALKTSLPCNQSTLYDHIARSLPIRNVPPTENVVIMSGEWGRLFVDNDNGYDGNDTPTTPLLDGCGPGYEKISRMRKNSKRRKVHSGRTAVPQ